MKRLIFCAVLMAWSTMASAVVYKWVDAQGHVQYGDDPPDGVKAELVRLLGTREPTAEPAAKAPAPSSAAAFADQALAQQKTAAEQQAVSQDVAAARQKQCADAQTHYTQLIQGRHIYTVGPHGERDYLTSEQIDAARLNAKQAVDNLCGTNGT